MRPLKSLPISTRGKKLLDKQVIKIAENPSLGAEKKATYYRYVGNYIELIMIGPHENYYRDLKNYLKAEERIHPRRTWFSTPNKNVKGQGNS